MLIGVIAGIVTGALWGLTFVASRAVAPFTAWDITVSRYGLFGLVSVGLMLLPRFSPARLSRQRVAVGFVLGAVCYPGYFLSIAFAVERAGPAIPPLVVGLMPVVLAAIGNMKDRSVPWRRLQWPLLLIATGVFVVNGEALHGGSPAQVLDTLTGAGWATLALVIWVMFGAVNAVVMQGRDAPSALGWTCMQGAGALAGSVALLPLTGLVDHHVLGRMTGTPEGLRFLAWAVVMGIGGSWFAAWSWIVAAQRLPLAFAAQLVVFETIFGLIDGFLINHRWPLPLEWIGSMLQIAGVVVSIGLFTKPPAETTALAEGAACRLPP